MSVEIETNHNSCVSDTVHSISLSGCIAERWKASATKHQNFRKESSRFCNCPWIWFHLALKIESSRFWLSVTVHEFDSSICLSACIAISRKLVQECIRRFQAFAPVVYINGRHYLNLTTQNAQQKEHLKSQFLKEQSLVSILLLQLSLCLISSALVSATDLCCCKMNDLLEIYDLKMTTYICMANNFHKLEITYQISHVSWLAGTPNVSIYKSAPVPQCYI